MDLPSRRLSEKVTSFVLKLWFFTKARLREHFSYKTRFILSFCGLALSPLHFYFWGAALSMYSSEYLAKYGGNYFLFLLTGVVLSNQVIYPSIVAFTEQVQRDTYGGVIGAQLSTPVGIVTYLLLNTSWDFALRFYGGAVMVAFGLILSGGFGLQLNFVSVSLVVLLVLLLLVANSAIGLLGAAVTLVYKYPGRAMFMMFAWFCMYLCGGYFPIEVLPSWLQAVSRIIPSTYGFEGVREAVLNASPNMGLIYYDICVLALLCVVLLPIGIFSIRRALKRIKKEGTLDVY